MKTAPCEKSTPFQSLPHVVIVGAGFGGLRAAQSLRKAPVRITIVDRRNHHLFQPLLYQVATAALSPADIAAPIRSVLRNQANTEVMLAEVTGIEPVARRVLFGEHSISYDFLVVATGARHSYFGKEEWSEFAPGLKSIEDATSIRSKLLLAFEAAEMETDLERRKALLTFVVIGGGPTGVEMAGAIADIAYRALERDFRNIDPSSARVLLVEAGPRLLAAFPESLAAKARRDLEQLGVEVQVGTRVANIDARGVQLPQGFVPAQNLIWAAGVKASMAGQWLGAETDRAGRAVVQADLTLLAHPNVYVIGDTASVAGPNGKPLPGLAPVAMQQGIYAARSIMRRISGRALPGPFHYVDKGNLATIGKLKAIADVRGLKFSGFIGWLMWAVVHIFYLISFRNRVVVLVQWMFAFMTFQRGARLITVAGTMEVAKQPRQSKIAE